MTIDEDIRNLETQYNYKLIMNQIEDANALRLGIEALKLLENPTDPRLIYARKLLLGETERRENE